MAEFLNLLPPDEARQLFLSNLSAKIIPEEVETREAAGRVTAQAVVAPHPLPTFPRSAVDGFAVRAADTYGASESIPVYLNVIGEVPMGEVPARSLNVGQCMLIHTGGMLPEAANSVVMVENTQSVREREIEVLKSVSVGENIIAVGEDVLAGEVVIESGKRLRPEEIGGLMALGITRVKVASKPKIGLLSSGDEVVPPEANPGIGQVRDVNAYTLSALIQEVGGIAIHYGIIPDQPGVLRQAARKALTECDLAVITAGSSASTRDLTADVINELGQPGVLVHGVNVRPGKPTILAMCDGKAVVGLPGNPVSALVIARLLVVPVIEKMLGLQYKRPRPFLPARLSLNVPSQAGREDWVPVRLLEDKGEIRGYRAEPVFGKSNLIFTLARADGLVRIPPDATGLTAGEFVEVHIL